MTQHVEHHGQQPRSEWTKPQAIFGVINFLVLVVTVVLSMQSSNATVLNRLIALETTMQFRVLPSLGRIENHLDNLKP